jgi:WD40 repeat protein
VRFDAWKAAHVIPSRHEVPVSLAKHSDPKLASVSPRLRQELIHPNRKSTLVGLRFSADGKRLVAGDDPGGVILVWDVASGKEVVTIEGGEGSRSNPDYFFVSPDWKTLYVVRSKRNTQRVEEGGKRWVRLFCNDDIRAWDMTTGRLQRIYKHNPSRGINYLRFSDDGSGLATFEYVPGILGRDAISAVSVWDVSSGEHRSLPDGLSCDGVPVYYHQPGLLSPDGSTVAVAVGDNDGHTHALKLFDSTTRREKRSIPIKDKNVWLDLAAISPNGRIVVGSYRVFTSVKKRDSAKLWLRWYDATKGEEIASFASEDNDRLDAARFAPDGQALAAVTFGKAEKTRLYLFGVAEKKLRKTIVFGESGKKERVHALSPVFSPDSKWLAVITQVLPETSNGDFDYRDAQQPRIHLVDVATGEIRETLIAPQGFPRSACFSPDGQMLATGGLGRVLLWDLSKPPGTLTGAMAPLDQDPRRAGRGAEVHSGREGRDGQGSGEIQDGAGQGYRRQVGRSCGAQQNPREAHP